MHNSTTRRLTFLGTGTSTGVPEIACQCPTCRSHDPRDQRLRSSVLIEVPSGALMIDTGPDFRQQCLRADVQHLEAILITHEHYDHVGGMDDIRPLFRDGQPCLIYAEERVIATQRERMPYAFSEHKYPGVPDLRLLPITPGVVYRDIIPDLHILPLRVMHGRLPIVGYRIGDDLAYITDAKTLPPDTIDALHGVSTLVINALRTEPHPAHMSLSECLEVIEQIAPHHTYLTHFAHTFGTHEQISALCPTGVTPAYDTLTIEW